MSKMIAVTMGDPAGIGPEIIIKSLAEGALSGAPVVVVGCAQTLRRILALNITPRAELRIIDHPAEASFSPATINVIDEPLSDPQGLRPGEVQAQAGDLAFRCIRRATALALEGAVAAIATAPLNKEALHLAGHAYPGHTELLAHLTQTTDYAMVLYTEKLKVIHITTHISLRQFLDTLNQPRIETVIGVADRFLRRVGYPRPRIAVAGVNPHAGENGLFGDEEIRIVAPAVAAMRAKGVEVTGPCPPDTVFMQCHEGMYDMVVAMYHDQGHIPLKLLGFYDGVNITAGLPFISDELATAISQQGLEAALDQPLARIMEQVQLALDNSNDKPDVIYLTGGSARSPLIKKALAAHLPGIPVAGGDDFGSVTAGLARWAQVVFR